MDSPNKRSPKPVAPPAYRPQPVPKVLQKKASPLQHPRTGQPSRPPVAPPVHRPQAKPVAAQAKMTPKTLQLKSRSVQSISGSRYPQTKGTGSVPFQSAVVQPSCFGSFCRWLGSFFSSNDERQEEAEELSMWEKRKAVIASRNLGLRSNVGHELRERGGNALALNYGLDDEAHWRESLSNFC